MVIRFERTEYKGWTVRLEKQSREGYRRKKSTSIEGRNVVPVKFIAPSHDAHEWNAAL